MSIDKARLAIGSRKRDGRYGYVTPPPVCAKIFNQDPRTTGYGLEELANNYVETRPTVAGEICAYRDNASQPRVLLLVAAPDAINVLTWYPVDMTSLLIDANTGKPYDPNASFYNPLAS